jgi:hypothetical protein
MLLQPGSHYIADFQGTIIGADPQKNQCSVREGVSS